MQGSGSFHLHIPPVTRESCSDERRQTAQPWVLALVRADYIISGSNLDIFGPGAQEMAAKIVATLLEGDTEVGEPAQAEKLFDFIAPLIADIPGADAGQDEEVRPHERALVWGVGFVHCRSAENLHLCPSYCSEPAHCLGFPGAFACLFKVEAEDVHKVLPKPENFCKIVVDAVQKEILNALALAGQDFEEEQGAVARLIHRLRSPRPGQHFAVLRAARARLRGGGARRLRFVLPPIAFQALGLVHLLAEGGAGAGPSGSAAAEDGDAEEAEEVPTAEAVRECLPSLPSVPKHGYALMVSYAWCCCTWGVTHSTSKGAARGTSDLLGLLSARQISVHGAQVLQFVHGMSAQPYIV